QTLNAQSRAAISLERSGQHAGKHLLQVEVIQLWPPFLTMGRHQQHAGIVADSQADAAQPALYLVLLPALTSMPDHHVHGTTGKEELMTDPVDLLTSEIPHPHRHIRAERRVAYSKRRDLYAMRGRPPLHKRS